MTTERPGSPAPLVIDGGDRLCAELILELSRRVGRTEPGTVVHLIATDPAAPLDLPAWCHLTGHTYLGPVPGTPRPAYALRVSPGARRTRGDAPWHPLTPSAPPAEDGPRPPNAGDPA
ncbi:sulfurtransferase TusA family protein [Streptomyces sp. F63]|uniref:sulfurtransferase TusA family protein n=1 Tax=Streptomyces sp. F63 TaxID=2824887 RepID=UPI001B38646D|nr:sulfurtransferase TusA family protein [Streptomyces sp. F63]MBQ0986059.1 sulfurtransferase TusA family protein [Streptomyces sp. F63]